MLSKSNIIKKAEKFLAEAGLTQQDYTISLMGPTVIFTESGRTKFEKDSILRADLLHLGVGLM